MALTAQQKTYLTTADQRFQAHVALFDPYIPTITPPAPADEVGTLLAPTPMIRIAPRKAMVASSSAIELYAGDSYERGGAAAAGTKNWSADVGSLDVSTGDTVNWTAPAGSGVATITVTLANANGTSTAYAHIQYPKTTYDAIVAEVASISGSLTKHGWEMLVRARGDVTDFALGKGILLHIEDTWDGTKDTFGGYRYNEGVMFGYISEMEYFEDAAGQSWLGLQVKSPWWMLENTEVGETLWGRSEAGGRFWIADFAPVDAIWKFVQDITDFTAYHDVIMWFDQNSIDDFIIDESDLGTIVADVMGRTLSIAYCDRYGSLFCIPDPDVRSAEFWGTPDPWLAMDETYVSDYEITYNTNLVKKLTLEGVDNSKLGIYAFSENPTAMGATKSIRGLICDDAETLAGWSVEKRAQMNRPWQVEVGLHLNHIVDLCNFIDVDLVNPTQSNGKTASGRTWVNSVSYKPDIMGGSWNGGLLLLKQTEGDGEGEASAASGWGGTGQYWTGANAYSGSAQVGSGTGGWASGTGGPTSWCYLFDFVNDGNGGWTTLPTEPNPIGDPGTYVAGVGWSAEKVKTTAGTPGPYGNHTATMCRIEISFPSRVLTQVHYGVYSPYVAEPLHEANLRTRINGDLSALTQLNNGLVGSAGYAIVKTFTANHLLITCHIDDVSNPPTESGSVIASAVLYGLGGNPFGEDNCL